MMNARLETASTWAPPSRWWLGVAVLLAIGFLLNWGIAFALLALIFLEIARPLDFVPIFLVVVAGAASVFNESNMTAQLTRLTVAVALMSVVYLLHIRRRAFSVPRVGLAKPLLLFLGLTILNAGRGILTGQPGKNVGLELFPLLGLGCGLLLANTFEARRDLRFALTWAVLVGFGVAIWGFRVFGLTHAHIIGFYTMAIPGFAGLLLINLALRASSPMQVVGWLALSMPLFLHQFITFGRGLWTGCIAGILVSLVAFGGFGRGSSPRWARVSLVLVVLLGFLIAGMVAAAVVFGQADLLSIAWTRFTSISSTDRGLETRSNIIRLMEYARAFRYVLSSPIVGQGVGFTFSVRDPFGSKMIDQWGVHENFLLIWLKQGLIGLAIFIWMLASAISLGVRQARRRTDPLEATWFATTAAATVFMVAFSLSNFPFSRVNETFFLAMLWGGSMGMARTGLVTLRWHTPPGPEGVHPQRSSHGPRR